MVTLIDFHADWCGPCIAMEPVIEELKEKYADKVELKKVDVDDNQEEAQKFNVMSIPTFVILDDEGNELDRKMGAVSKDQFDQWIQSHIS